MQQYFDLALYFLKTMESLKTGKMHYTPSGAILVLRSHYWREGVCTGSALIVKHFFVADMFSVIHHIQFLFLMLKACLVFQMTNLGVFNFKYCRELAYFGMLFRNELAVHLSSDQSYI